MNKFGLLSCVLTILVIAEYGISNGVSRGVTFTLHAESYYQCDEKLTVQAREPVQIKLMHNTHLWHAWCMFNKHKEQLNRNLAGNQSKFETNIEIKPEAYMTGTWGCVALYNKNQNRTIMAKTCHEDGCFEKISCDFNVTVKDDSQKQLWSYIAVGISGLLIIIIAQTGIILWYWRRARRTKHIDEFALTQHGSRDDDRARYSDCPGFRNLLSKNKKPKESEDSGSIYETLEAMADGADPPPPPIDTLPRTPKKSFTNKIFRTGTSIPKEDDSPTTLPKKELPQDAQSEVMEHVKNRPPMPLPTEPMEAAVPVKQTNKKEDREPLVRKESAAFPATVKSNTGSQSKPAIKKEGHESLVGKVQERSGPRNNRKSTNPESVAIKKSKDNRSTMNQTANAAMSELDFILKNRREGTFSKKLKPTCSVKPEPKGQETTQHAASGPKFVSKVTPTAKSAPTKPNTATQFKKVAATPPSKATQPATQQVKPTVLRAALLPTSKQIPEQTQSAPQTALQRSGKMPHKPPPEVPRMKPPMPLPLDKTPTEPPSLRPDNETTAEIYEEPNYEPYNSDEEWTEEELDEYHLYSV